MSGEYLLCVSVVSSVTVGDVSQLLWEIAGGNAPSVTVYGFSVNYELVRFIGKLSRTVFLFD